MTSSQRSSGSEGERIPSRAAHCTPRCVDARAVVSYNELPHSSLNAYLGIRRMKASCSVIGLEPNFVIALRSGGFITIRALVTNSTSNLFVCFHQICFYQANCLFIIFSIGVLVRATGPLPARDIKTHT